MSIQKVASAGRKILQALGLVSNVETIITWGTNADIDVGYEDLWSYGGVKVDDTVAQTLYIASSSAADTENILISGLDANYAVQEETITLTGQTVVTVPGTWLRVQSAKHVGSATLLVGNVITTIADNFVAGVPQAAAEVRNRIAAGEQRSEGCHYTVPAGYTALIVGVSLTMRNGTAETGVTTKLKKKTFGETYHTVGAVVLQSSGDSQYNPKYGVFYKLLEKEDVKIQATSTNANSWVEGKIEILLIKNTLIDTIKSVLWG